MAKNIDKIKGCLIGGAAGDALGYPIEFYSGAQIFSRYKSKGLTEYILDGGVARISDDTQMTLFTAAGLTEGNDRRRNILAREKMSYSTCIWLSYLDWLRTQQSAYDGISDSGFSRLAVIPELYSRRAPGTTCLSALYGGEPGSITDPINNSKGCGGVMRVAPIGLYFDKDKVSIEKIDSLGAEAAALTHGNPLGYIPGAALVHIVALLSQDGAVTVSDAVADMLLSMKKQFCDEPDIGEFTWLINRAVELSRRTDISDVDAIGMLGEGWVADEALAIAVYCALKYENDFDSGLVSAVNHKGDSDSTGAITGNILGAYLGLERIPSKYTEKLELKDIILELAEALFRLNDSEI